MWNLLRKNLWRNTRRTCLTILSVFFVVTTCILTESVHKGIWHSSLQQLLRIRHGHIEISNKAYADQPSPDHFLMADSLMFNRLRSIEGVEGVFPCTESFAMASSDNTSKGVMVWGIDPELEEKRMAISSMIVAGCYLQSTDRNILVGEKLSRYLGIAPGDSIALLGRGYHGSTAVGLYCVQGIFSCPIPEVDRSIIYMTLPTAQEFLNVSAEYSGIYLLLKQEKSLPAVIEKVKTVLDCDNCSVTDWKASMQDLLIYSDAAQALGIAVTVLLYLVAGSGLLSTVIMTTNERRHEFGLMIALGMRRSRLTRTIIYEHLFILAIGIVAALGFSLPITGYFNRHPLQITGDAAEVILHNLTKPEISFYFESDLFASQILAIFFIGCATLFYPIIVIRRLRIESALITSNQLRV